MVGAAKQRSASAHDKSHHNRRVILNLFQDPATDKNIQLP
jgi:hypothetical protein